MAGQMVGENYGPIFTKRSLLERSRSLMSRYWFKCECNPCRENWQILDKLNNKARLKWVGKFPFWALNLFDCHCRCTTPLCDGVHNYPENPRKILKCLKCKKMVSLQEHAALLLECEELYRKGAEFMDVSTILTWEPWKKCRRRLKFRLMPILNGSWNFFRPNFDAAWSKSVGGCFFSSALASCTIWFSMIFFLNKILTKF